MARRGRKERHTSWLWPAFALPGVAWLIALFVVPFYGVLAVGFGGVDPIFGSPVPEWNPTRWHTSTFSNVLDEVFGGRYQPVFTRTIWYVAISLALCFLIGYPVAYYVARYGGRRRALLLALILAPFWINY